MAPAGLRHVLSRGRGGWGSGPSPPLQPEGFYSMSESSGCCQASVQNFIWEIVLLLQIGKRIQTPLL